MKTAFGIVVLVAVLVIVFGSPIAGELPVKGHYYGSPDPILPMTFAHINHVEESCIFCHHNYVDDTGGGLCMNCHVTNSQTWPLFAHQFHSLCRDCHAEKAAEGVDGGPPRECIACHAEDDAP